MGELNRKNGVKEIPICDENKPQAKWYETGYIKQWKTILYQVVKHFLICNGFIYILETGKLLKFSEILSEGPYLLNPSFQVFLQKLEVKFLIFLLYFIGYLIHTGIMLVRSIKESKLDTKDLKHHKVLVSKVRRQTSGVILTDFRIKLRSKIENHDRKRIQKIGKNDKTENLDFKPKNHLTKDVVSLRHHYAPIWDLVSIF